MNDERRPGPAPAMRARRLVPHEGFTGTYEESAIVVFGVPFDGTVSNRPGTRFGPDGIRSEIDGLETYSPVLDVDLADHKLCDLGDLELAFGHAGRVLERVRAACGELLADGKRPVALGGEHLISLPLIEAHHERYPDLCVVHLDAHADLREDYLGEPLSHATVMRRVAERIGGDSLLQFGIRSGTKEEFRYGRAHTRFHPFSLDALGVELDALGDRPVYLSVDLDVLDPSVLPGTGTPEPGGIGFNELMRAIHRITRCHVVGADLVELAPSWDASGASNAVAAKALRELAAGMLKFGR